jgi:hypothetical protein
MPASALFPTGATPDVDAAVYGIELFSETSGAGDARGESERFFFASKVVLQAGDEPSYAVAEIPLTAFVETAPALSAINGGAIDGIRIGQRAMVFVYSSTLGSVAPLLCGSVVNIQQDIASDGATLTIFDDRWLLRGIPVAGQFIYQPAEGTIVYRQRGPARFNPRGRPNCLDSSGGPLFAPYPDYGREDGDADPAPGAATRAARPWRHSDIAAYLRRTLCNGELSAQTSSFPWFARLDESRMLVPESFGVELEGDPAPSADDSRSAAGFTASDRESGATGKAPDLTLEGLDLLSALTRVVESAGAYALNCSAQHEQSSLGGRGGRSLLEIVTTRFIDGAARAMNILRPCSGTISDSAGRIGVFAGQIEEDGSDVYTSVVVCGDPVQLELRVEYTGSSGALGLEPAWSADDEAEFRAYVRDHPDYPDSPEAFVEACWKFPRVFAAYHVPDNFDYLSGTKYESFPRVAAHPPILPRLLSTFSETISSNKRRLFSYPVSIELKNDEGAYRSRSQLDGLEVDDDGTLWLTALREAGLYENESGTWQGALDDADAITARDLRITLALQLDHRVCTALGLSSETPSAEGTLAQADPNSEAARVSTDLKRQYFADVGAAYREQLRKDAWPLPQSVQGSSAAEDRTTDGDELLSDAPLAAVHAQRRLAEVARVRKTTRLVFPSAMLWKPGQAVEALENRNISSGNYALRGVVARVTHAYESNTTEIELA